MKMLSGVLVVTAVLLSACGTPPPEGNAGAVEPEQLRTSEQALRGDCSVSVMCGDGNPISCPGTGSTCASGFDSYYGVEYVVCNGNYTFCPMSTGNCLSGKRCSTNGDCGMDGMCTTSSTRPVCVCY
ncbi:MAG TPA: hypothetical protein VE153_15760 [Myxococcus sp.]|nr:hypothetical protein [Myxococcus sp.]